MQQASTHAASRFPWRTAAAGSALAGLALVNRARTAQSVRDNPPLGRFVEIDGVRLHWLERGSGPPVVLVHGNGTMVQDWLLSGVVDDLAVSHRVIMLDRPGFGHSSRPRGIRWTASRQAALVAGFIRALELDDALVVGHSFAALVVAALALKHPERLRGAALLSGYYFPTPRADVLLAVPSAVPGLGDVLGYTFQPLLGEAMQERLNAHMFGPAQVPERWREEFPWAMALRPSQARASASDAIHLMTGARHHAARWGEIKVPVTIAAGTGDRIVDPEAQSGRLHHVLPGSRLHLIEGVGHMVHHSARDAIVAAIHQA